MARHTRKRGCRLESPTRLENRGTCGRSTRGNGDADLRDVGGADSNNNKDTSRSTRQNRPGVDPHGVCDVLERRGRRRRVTRVRSRPRSPLPVCLVTIASQKERAGERRRESERGREREKAKETEKEIKGGMEGGRDEERESERERETDSRLFHQHGRNVLHLHPACVQSRPGKRSYALKNLAWKPSKITTPWRKKGSF